MTDFSYDAIPGRVVFANGSRQRVADEVSALGGRRVLVIASDVEAGIADELDGVLGPLAVGRFSDVVQHVPVAQAAAARERVRQLDADTVVTIGGGSATGLGKAVALEIDVLQVAVPTTYAGSEMTPIWGMTEGDDKRTGSDMRVKPELVVYDPELTLSLPPHIAGPSGMNALAHAVEALYGPGANPFISAVALESIAALRTALPAVVQRPDDVEARSDALYGAYLAGVALATGGTALHHKACHVLGGMFNLDHGQMNAVVLGHAVAFNAPAMPDVMGRIGAALEVAPEDVPGSLFDLAAEIDAPTDLASIGMPADGIDAAARRVVSAASGNIRPPSEDGIRQMLSDAFAGRRPG